MQKQNQKYLFYAIPILIVAFIFIGICIFNFSGITNLISNNFYNYINQDTQGKVAGESDEYPVRMAAEDDPIARSCWDDVKGHCYPRTGALHWESSSSDWDSNFDLLIIPKRSEYVTDYAKKVKAKNPHIIILPTCDINDGECLKDEEWKMRKSDGSTVKIYGGGFNWVDYTDFAPRLSQYNNKRFNEYIGTAMIKEVDLSVVDGVATDGIWISGWSPESEDIDIDRNGINDYIEHNKWWVQEQIKTGALHAMESIKNA
ncbi:hypothetical protein KKA66_03860, partial [Patescibacteria group bacterium]|nr:hypothetical protein [Patescibacteria group bacterium]